MSSHEQKTHEEPVADAAETLNTAAEQPETEQADAAAAAQARIAELEHELEESRKTEREAMLRAKAEIENNRRRMEQDVEKAHKFALERFSNELLPVIDNLERALSAVNPEDEAQKSMLEGLELTLKSFLDAVKNSVSKWSKRQKCRSIRMCIRPLVWWMLRITSPTMW